MMTLDEKIEALKFASFHIGYADPREAYRYGRLHSSDVRQYPFEGSMPVAVLDRIARGEDQGDQSTTWERSNYRRLLADFPGALIEHSWSNVSGLALFPHSVSDDLVNTVCGLSVDYPIYDESDMGDLEWHEIEEAFDQYLWADHRSEIGEDAEDLAPLFTDVEIRDAFYAAMSDANYYPEHGGLDIHWDRETVRDLLRTALFNLAATIVPVPAQDTLI
jgi:hypothetical protein